jgi:nucleoside-diphosphate-sugar epimerase
VSPRFAETERSRRRVIGIARRPFDPAELGWTKLAYRRGDVRDAEALGAAFEGADVVVHLAILILGGSAATTRAINGEGTLNTFRAAAAAGAERFVYASSIGRTASTATTRSAWTRTGRRGRRSGCSTAGR